MSNSSDDERPSKRRKICVVTDVDDAFSRRLEKVAEFLFTFPHSESETKNISVYLRINESATRDEVVCAVKVYSKHSIFELLDCFTMTNLLALYQFLSGNGRWSYGKSSLCSSIRDYVYFGFFPLSRRIEERSVLDIQKIEPWNIFFELRGISVPCDVVMIIVSFMDGTLDNLELISRDWYMVSLISHQSCTIRSNNLFRAPLNVIKYTKSVLLNLNYMTDKEITYVWESLSPTRLRSLEIYSPDTFSSKKFLRVARDHEIMVGLRTLILCGVTSDAYCDVEMRLATIFPNLSKVKNPPFIQWCIGLIHLETLSLCGSHDLVILGEFASLKHLALYEMKITEGMKLYLAKTIIPRLESFDVYLSMIEFFEHITEDLPLKNLKIQYTTNNSLSALSKYTRLDSLTCNIYHLHMMKSQLNVLTSLYVTGIISSPTKHMALLTEVLVKSRYWRKLKFYIINICGVNIQILREAKVIEINFRIHDISFENIERFVNLALISHQKTKPEWCCLKIMTRSQLSSRVMRETKDLMFGKGFRYVRTDRTDVRNDGSIFGGEDNSIGGIVSVFRLREK